MSFRFLTLFLLVCCCYLAGAVKELIMNGKSYTVMAYPEDCQKYMLCSDGKCKLMSCDPTYVFDPVTSICTHRRGSVNCAARTPLRRFVI